MPVIPDFFKEVKKIREDPRFQNTLDAISNPTGFLLRTAANKTLEAVQNMGKRKRSSSHGGSNKKQRKSKTKSRKKSRSSSKGLSQYHESQVIYSRKAAPKWKKRKARKWKKGVDAVLSANSKRTTLTLLSPISAEALEGGQVVLDFTLCSGFQTGSTQYGDMRKMLDQIAGSTDTNADEVKQNIYVNDFRMNLIISSCQSTPSIVTLYYFYVRKSSVSSPFSLLDKGFASPASGGDNEGVEGTAPGAAQALLTYGSTPFGSTPFCQHCTIYKVTRHIIQPQESIEITLKKNIRKQYTADPEELQSQVILKPGWTSGVILVAYGIPNSLINNAASLSSKVAIKAVLQRIYNFHEIQLATRREDVYQITT